LIFCTSKISEGRGTTHHHHVPRRSQSIQLSLGPNSCESLCGVAAFIVGLEPTPGQFPRFVCVELMTGLLACYIGGSKHRKYATSETNSDTRASQNALSKPSRFSPVGQRGYSATVLGEKIPPKAGSVDCQDLIGNQDCNPAR
jgi:hypothetical protein